MNYGKKTGPEWDTLVKEIVNMENQMTEPQTLSEYLKSLKKSIRSVIIDGCVTDA